jgi:hypothetical protein
MAPSTSSARPIVLWKELKASVEIGEDSRRAALKVSLKALTYEIEKLKFKGLKSSPPASRPRRRSTRPRRCGRISPSGPASRRRINQCRRCPSSSREKPGMK